MKSWTWSLCLAAVFLLQQNGVCQSIFDVPDHCAVTLNKDIYTSITTRDQDLAYASLVDEKTYDLIKHDASAGATIPVTAGLVNGTANYSDYQNHVHALYTSLNIHYTQKEAQQVFSATTSERAFKSFDNCMKELSKNAAGFYAWITHEDYHDVQVACHFTGPGGAVTPLRVHINVVQGGTIAGKKTASQTVQPGADCAPISVERQGEGLVKVSLAGNGWPSALVVSEYKKPPANVATLSYTPLEKQEEDVQIKQENFFNFNPLKQTVDLDNWGGCKAGWPPEYCSSTQRYSMPTTFELDPPLDGDNYDPGSVNIASYESVDGRNGGLFCEQYDIKYFSRSAPNPQWIMTPEVRKYWEQLQGKHELWVGIRCWGAPARVRLRYKRYHMVPGKQVVNAEVPFDAGEDFRFEPPADTPSTITFKYGKGTIAILKPGQSSDDGKIQFKQAVEFAGTKYYVYHYAE